MKNNEKNDKLSISELLKRLREQADAMPDEETESLQVQEEETKSTTGTRYRFRVTKRRSRAGGKAEEYQNGASEEDDVTRANTAEVPVTPVTIDFDDEEDAETSVDMLGDTAEVPKTAEAETEDEVSVDRLLDYLFPDEENDNRDGEPLIEIGAAAEQEKKETKERQTQAAASISEEDVKLYQPEPKTEEEGAALYQPEPDTEEEDAALYQPEAEEEDLETPPESSFYDELMALEDEPYMPAGAEAQRQDTGDVTYVYDGTDGTEQEPEEELVPPELDETDVNLMIAFGMDDELAKAIDEGRREQVEQELSDIEQKLHKEEEKEAFEYTSATQNKRIFRNYKRRYKRVLVKIAICAVLLLITFLYENISAFGGDLADAINPKYYPVTHIMVDLQLVLIGGALIWRRLKDGLVSLVRFKPTPDSMILFSLLFTVGYDIAMCFLPYGTDLHVYGFPMVLGVMCALIYELFNLKREIFSFHIVASKRLKFTIGRLDADRAVLEQEAFRDYLPDSPNIFKLNKASFVDGFYAKMKPSGSNRRMMALLIIFTLMLSTSMGLLGAIWTDSVMQGIVIGYTALMISMPMAVYLTYSFPFYRASQIAYDQDSAILGDGAIDEYAEASAITFDDRDVFPSHGVKVRSIKVFGNHRIDNIIYHAASVFRVAGGPLSDVFDIATADLGHSEDVRLLSVDSDGIEAVVSGTHLYFGKEEYLRRNHFHPLVEDDDIMVGNASIMYMVSDDEVVAKMYIQYRIDPYFEKTLKQLYRYGICVGIKTLDPNIDDEMLSRRIKLDKYPVRILKCREAEDNTKVLERTESGLVSKHSAKALLKAFTLCAKVQRMIRTDTAINVISMLAGIVVMLLTLVFNVAGQIPSFYVALYQLFWAIPMFFMAKMMI